LIGIFGLASALDESVEPASLADELARSDEVTNGGVDLLAIETGFGHENRMRATDPFETLDA